ncbi:putative carbamoyl transferase, NodU family [Thiorhodovibrio winogradskyi]|uniref:Carbamoyl transferase, NodU family n=1 Tax=Thiorhodovibrio winogradskyi TaxID=77007 RepID=A0ABZ0SFK4_9GAMM|nr:carbamoyltransferase C-terminal domain-containing protein [Thiorhodovibrio winogradskyi]
MRRRCRPANGKTELAFRNALAGILEKETVPTYFEQTVDSPFMQHVVKIRPEWRERLPAVTHVDGTGRLQTVDQQSNRL